MFRAHDAVRDRPVAVKLFTLDLAPERVHQLVAELKRIIAADLTHAALAAPLAAGIHGVSAYLVQEYVAADSLDLVIREYGVAPAVDALRVAAQLAGALDFAAAVHVRHGALHPRDVLLSSDDTRLTGVGIAQALERIGVPAPVRRPYTPPERIAGGEWDRRADVFSLATVTHELLWARRVSGVGARAVENLTEIPGADLGALRVAFARALAEDPASRFETALEFAEALRRACPDIAIGGDQSAGGSHQSAGGGEQSAVASPHSTVASRPAKRAARIPDRAESADVEPQLPLLDRETEVDLPISAIAGAEEERYRDVEAAPAIVGPDARAPTPGSRSYLDYVRDEPERIDLGIREPSVAEPVAVREAPPDTRPTLERSRSSMWPLMIALAVGLTMGFAAGYGAGTRQRPVPAAAAPPAATPPAPAGREFTESAVDPNSSVRLPPSRDASADRHSLGGGGQPDPTPAPTGVPPQPDSDTVRLKADTTAASNDGRLLVRSTPAGALVFVDGKEYGPTPVAVRDLSSGGHRVRVVRDGYAAAERRVVITPSRPSQSLTIALERPGNAAARGGQTTGPPAPPAPGPSGRFTGALAVVSRPPGATVFMDGKLVGTTPLSLRSVAAGSHAIRLEHEGYRRWTSAIRVVASEQNRVTASLER